MFNGIESQGGVKHGGLIYSLYFIILVVFGNCILPFRLTPYLGIVVQYTRNVCVQQFVAINLISVTSAL